MPPWPIVFLMVSFGNDRQGYLNRLWLGLG